MWMAKNTMRSCSSLHSTMFLLKQNAWRITPFSLLPLHSTMFLLKLGKSKTITKYICLSFISFLPLFHFCCIYYFGSLIFCCQFVARFIITGRKTFDKYCLFYILASLYALSSSLSLNILYIHSGIA